MQFAAFLAARRHSSQQITVNSISVSCNRKFEEKCAENTNELHQSILKVGEKKANTFLIEDFQQFFKKSK